MTPAPAYRATASDIVTYNLRAGASCSDEYYRRVDGLAQEVRLHGAQVLWTALPLGGEPFLRPGGRSRAIFELLTLGVLRHTYVAPSSCSPRRGERRRRVAVRQPVAPGRQPSSREGQPDTEDERGGGEDTCLHYPGTPEPRELDQLLVTLTDCGAYPYEVKALSLWRDRLLALPRAEWDAGLGGVARFAAWFMTRSMAVLGQFTERVDSFVSRQDKCLGSRPDASMRRRGRHEYHLNMVGSELLNHAYRREFRAARRKVVLLPACMRLNPGGCEAQPLGATARCIGCTPQCRVHHVCELVGASGAEVLVLERDLEDFTLQALGDAPCGEIGVVGVSCVLTNAAGGLAAGQAGIPAQGVLLDYCGCSWHWHDRGIPTDVSLQRLETILQT